MSGELKALSWKLEAISQPFDYELRVQGQRARQPNNRRVLLKLIYSLIGFLAIWLSGNPASLIRGI